MFTVRISMMSCTNREYFYEAFRMQKHEGVIELLTKRDVHKSASENVE